MRDEHDSFKSVKFGFYEEDALTAEWTLRGVAHEKKTAAAAVMDWADDVAYSVHDLKTGLERVAFRSMFYAVTMAGRTNGESSRLLSLNTTPHIPLPISNTPCEQC